MSDCCVNCDTPTVPSSAGQPRPVSHEARGLCGPCYDHALHTRKLDDYPRRTRSRDELMDEWDHLRQSGVPWQFAHDRLGVTQVAFERAYARARADGDHRALEGAGQRAQRAATTAAVTRAVQAAHTDEPARWSYTPTSQRDLDHAHGAAS